MKQKKSPPLTLSLTTGLLTLSVHDKLTFDGVEVALHPDLFINIGCNLNQGCSSGNVGVGVGVGVGIGSRSASHSRQQSRDSSAFVHQHQHQHQHSRDASFASSIFNTTPGQTNYNAPATPILVQEEGNAFMRKDTPISMKSASTAGVGNQSPQRQHSSNVLKVGDLIEIKVWEQKNNNHHGQKDVNGNFNASDHQSNVVARAATKLEQVANHQSAVSSSTFQSMMYHPLAADPSSATVSTSVSATTATNTNTNTTNKSSLLSSSRPPMVPKSVSNASSTVASPMHSGSFTPSLLPSPRSSHPTPKTLPRMDPSTSIYREDFMNDSNNGNGNDNGNATGNDIDTGNGQTSIPFQAPLEIIGPSSSLVNNGDTFTPNSSNTPTLDRSRSFANADDDDSVNHSLNHNHVSMTGNELGGTLKEVNVQHHQEKQSEIRQQEHQSQQQSQQQDMIGIISNTHVLKTKFVISVTEKSLTTLKSSGRTQISLLKPGMCDPREDVRLV